MPPAHAEPCPRRAARRRGPLAAVALVLLLVAALGACSTVRTITDLTAELEDEGFRDVTVTVGGGEPFVLVVRADAPPGTTTAEGHDRAAEVVWTTFPRHFERLEVTVDGDTRAYTDDDLAEELGPRPEGLDEGGDLTREWTRLALGTVAGIAVGGLLLLVVVGLGVILVVRARRRAAPARSSPPAPWAPSPGPPAPPTPPAPAEAQGPPVAPGDAGPADPSAPADPLGAAGPTPPPGGWRPPGTPPPEAPPAAHTAASAAAAVDRRHRDHPRHAGRPPRGPRPPATQLPPGWG